MNRKPLKINLVSVGCRYLKPTTNLQLLYILFLTVVLLSFSFALSILFCSKITVTLTNCRFMYL